ncbi:hypothetical protein H4W33_009869 [Kibdelosporangium phytohabitans]|uniref:ANTAR domain-containing protein n=1 Tax=Kibdelosporangium phytohabitans TaxID=860235 RepID=A0A0N9I0L4_9PSEU|nr:ANTAR domain-containing protein [Kibdelosporangium phytohabitans]ALG08202.1 hypothetical protein AOZ06_15950 [Kibdelosporangium phytohabitans]MBE1470795.1 hypothetical protein [Kibdelosporangium phytohabitans]
MADLLSQHAAVALVGVTREQRLHEALRSRDVIGQAKGILMHRDRLTAQRLSSAERSCVPGPPAAMA